jgi:hypothetical protein
VPLRPVSELGLVDLTDVPAREGNRTATRSRSTRARRSPSPPLRSNSANDRQAEARADRPEGAPASTRRKPAADRRASKSLAGSAQPSAAAKGCRGGAAKRLEPSQSRAATARKIGSTAPVKAEDSGGKSNRARSSTAMKLGNTSERDTRRPKNAESTRSDQIRRADADAHLSREPRRVSASTTSPARSRGRSKPARDTGSGGATRSATGTRKQPNDSASTPRRATNVRRQAPAGSRSKGDHAPREVQRSRNGRGPERMKPPFAAKVGISVLMGAGLVAGGLLFARAAHHR